MTMQRTFALLLVPLLLLVQSSFALASGFEVTPPWQEIVVPPGEETVAAQVEVTNRTDFVHGLHLSVRDFGTLDESGGIAFLGGSTTDEGTYGLASWITLANDTIVIEPGETKVIEATIENRESLSPGGHYAAVVARLTNVVLDTDREVTVQPSFSSLLLAKKIGGEIHDLTVGSVDVSQSLWRLPDEATIRFRNDGNVHEIPRGIMVLQDPFSNEVARGILNRESAWVLPESWRKVVVPIKATSSLYLPGWYEISVHYRTEDNSDTGIHVERFFFVGRWGLVFFSAIFLLAMLILRFGRQYVSLLSKKKGK